MGGRVRGGSKLPCSSHLPEATCIDSWWTLFFKCTIFSIWLPHLEATDTERALNENERRRKEARKLKREAREKKKEEQRLEDKKQRKEERRLKREARRKRREARKKEEEEKATSASTSYGVAFHGDSQCRAIWQTAQHVGLDGELDARM